jgi:MFS family permease
MESTPSTIMRQSIISLFDNCSLTYLSPFIFEDMGLNGNSVNLLATGVVGVVEFLFTIPAVLWVDQIGRKKTLIAGAIGMAVCHFIVAAIIASYTNEWDNHRAAGWVAVVFVWIYTINFAYSWGKNMTLALNLLSRILLTFVLLYRTLCLDCGV